VSGAAAALQSARPALHTYLQESAWHDGVPVVVLQTLPHAPQVVVEDRELSQPSVSGAAAALQSARPALHT
jgi:hypothetical protein